MPRRFAFFSTGWTERTKVIGSGPMVPEYVKYVAEWQDHHWHYFHMWHTRKYGIRSMKYPARRGILARYASKFFVVSVGLT